MDLFIVISMKITIVYDNEALTGFKKGWGFACLIELREKKILFDTGEGPVTLANIAKLKINIEDISYIILSHPHFDHIGGLAHLINFNPKLTVIMPSFFPVKLKLELMSYCQTRETFGFEKILENIYVDVAMNHLYEQFCMIDLPQGLLVITGCAHPGLDNVLMKADRHDRPIYGVMGGFHGFNKLSLLKPLSFIAPCHCTKHKTEILKRFPNSAHPCASGSVFSF